MKELKECQLEAWLIQYGLVQPEAIEDAECYDHCNTVTGISNVLYRINKFFNDSTEHGFEDKN